MLVVNLRRLKVTPGQSVELHALCYLADTATEDKLLLLVACGPCDAPCPSVAPCSRLTVKDPLGVEGLWLKTLTLTSSFTHQTGTGFFPARPQQSKKRLRLEKLLRTARLGALQHVTKADGILSWEARLRLLSPF